MEKHYHVMNGIHGCMPDTNYVASTLVDARGMLKETVSNLRESGLTFNGNLKAGYFDSIKENYYADIEKCTQVECLQATED
jgi:hypothetical protein